MKKMIFAWKGTAKEWKALYPCLLCGKKTKEPACKECNEWVKSLKNESKVIKGSEYSVTNDKGESVIFESVSIY